MSHVIHGGALWRFHKWAFFLLFSTLWGQERAVTYAFSGGRFGDTLLCYLHAKWISYQYQIPLLYRPFPLSSLLMIHEQELEWVERKEVSQIVLRNLNLLNNHSADSTLYICPYFPEDPWELTHLRPPGFIEPYYPFPVDWKDPLFRKAALAMIAPRCEITYMHPEGSGIHVALHLREGGELDSEYIQNLFPLKFPPLLFYVEGLLAVLKLFPGFSIDCFVFTDAIDPANWVAHIKAMLPPDAPIVFRYRKNNSPRRNALLSDFFSLFLYDVLIRPQSNFSMLPSLLHDYAFIYSPKDCISQNGQIQITQVIEELNPVKYEKLLCR